GARDVARPTHDGGRVGRGAADRSARRIPAPAGAARGRAGRRTPRSSTEDLQPPARGARRSRRMARGLSAALAEPAGCPTHRDLTWKEGTEMTTMATMRALDETQGAV